MAGTGVRRRLRAMPKRDSVLRIHLVGSNWCSADPVAVVGGEGVVKVVVALAHAQQRHEEAVAGRAAVRIGLPAEEVGERVDGEGGVVGDHEAHGRAHDEATDRVAEGPAQQGRQHQAGRDPHPGVVARLKADQRIALEVAHGGVHDLGVDLAQHPAEVGVPEAALGVVGVEIAVGPPVVAPVVGGPGQGGVLEGAGAEEEQEGAQGRMSLVGPVGEQPVVPRRDAEDREDGEAQEDQARGQRQPVQGQVEGQPADGGDVHERQERDVAPVQREGFWFVHVIETDSVDN